MAVLIMQGDIVTSPVSDFSVTDDLTVADKIDAGGDVTFEGITRANDDFIAMGAAANKLIETDSSADKIGLFGATPIVQPTALTTKLTQITHTAPGTPDYALQDLVQNTGFGFVTKDEGNTALKVILNLQTRVDELETKLTALGALHA